MPEKYKRIKASYLKAGKSKKEASKLAAMTYNKERKKGQKPVTKKHPRPKGGKKT